MDRLAILIRCLAFISLWVILIVTGHVSIGAHAVLVMVVSQVFPHSVIGRSVLGILSILRPAFEIFHHFRTVVRHPAVIGGEVIDDEGKGADDKGNDCEHHGDEDFLHFGQNACHRN